MRTMIPMTTPAEPSGWSDPVSGRNPRDAHMDLTPEERERLADIEATLTPHEEARRHGDSAED